MARSLVDLKRKMSARVKQIVGGVDAREKILELGILPGDTVEILGKSFFGCPVAVKHGESNFFALRKDHAQFILIEDDI